MLLLGPGPLIWRPSVQCTPLGQEDFSILLFDPPPWTPHLYEAPLGLTAVSLQCGDEVVRIGFAVLASYRPNNIGT